MADQSVESESVRAIESLERDMSAEPYTDVSGDESGIVPPQSSRPPEWPKKIRTLTAAELDRLTIDSSGRFYWDGKLVNYEAPKPKGAPDDLLDRSMDILDRAAHELGEHPVPAPIEGGEPSPAGDYAVVGHDHAASLAEALAAQPSIRITEQARLTLTRWQSFALTLAIIGIAIGSFGVAASGFVAAHEWGCRTGMIRSACPPPPSPPPRRPDIPA